MLFAELTEGPAIAIGITAVAWLASLSYLLGRYTNKVDSLKEADDQHTATINKIFQRLDEIAKNRMPCELHDQRLKTLERHDSDSHHRGRDDQGTQR